MKLSFAPEIPKNNPNNENKTQECDDKSKTIFRPLTNHIYIHHVLGFKRSESNCKSCVSSPGADPGLLERGSYV